jgi:hypothetical protein
MENEEILIGYLRVQQAEKEDDSLPRCVIDTFVIRCCRCHQMYVLSASPSATQMYLDHLKAGCQ